jgi:hypothetical protein
MCVSLDQIVVDMYPMIVSVRKTISSSASFPALAQIIKEWRKTADIEISTKFMDDLNVEKHMNGLGCIEN